MAYEIPVGCIGQLIAGVDLSAAQFRAVKLNTSGTVELADATGDLPLGILQNAPKKDRPCNIMFEGVTKAEVDGGHNVSPGNVMIRAANGRLEPKAADTSEYQVGIALSSAAATNAAGEIITLLLRPGPKAA